MINFIFQLLRRTPGLVNSRVLAVLVAFTAKVVGAGFAFLFSVVLARLLGATGVGVYFMVLTIISIGAVVARLGLDNAVLRFASIAFDQADMSTLAALYKKSIGVVIGAGVVVAFLIWLGMPYMQLGGSQSSEFSTVLLVMLFALVPTALIMLQGEFFKAIGAPGMATTVQAIILPVLLVLGAAVLYWQGNATLSSIAFLYVISATVSVLFAGGIWYRYMPDLWCEQGSFDTRLLLRTSLPLLWVASMHMVMSWTDILVLGVWTDSATVGVYGVAARIATLTAFIMMAVNSVIVPRFAALYAQGNHKAMERLAQRSAAWMLIATLPMILLLLLYPQLILRLFGEEFVKGDLLLRILVLGQLVNVAMGSVGYLLIMSGHERVVRNILMVSALINFIGNLVLVPSFGAVGASLSTAFSLVVMNVLSYFLVIKKLKINTMGYMFKRDSICGNR